MNRNEIFTKCYKLENSKLTALETQIESLISKVNRLENDKILYQTENNKLKEELQRIASRYDDSTNNLPEQITETTSNQPLLVIDVGLENRAASDEEESSDSTWLLVEFSEPSTEESSEESSDERKKRKG
ncbi:15712_t:CDS:1 [Dentiscutata erythropus]|uniref:15712_t:CDS:1 n=1 Tax=Dentiscutata erythropus TaxID=1348616 RepID=A0A9N9JK10_9GLOM|nr:15712_t:CDS:1 [Dentiscutata erythropus]